jgi:hypothetical protein
MTELQASRTLVKSPPELWAECSDAASLARHLDGFGEIRITRLEPETAVAWEGERARGMVRIEPAGWGTKVILTAEAEGVEREEPPPPVQSEPEVIEPPAAVQPEPEVVEPPAPEPPPPAQREPEPEPEAIEAPAPEPSPPPRKRRFARLRAYWRGERLSAPEPDPDVAEETPSAAETPPPVAEEPSPAVEEPTLAVEEPMPAADAPPLAAEEPPPAVEAPPPAPDAPAPVLADTEAVLAAALDSLGQAHHRPYSRA